MVFKYFPLYQAVKVNRFGSLIDINLSAFSQKELCWEKNWKEENWKKNEPIKKRICHKDWLSKGLFVLFSKKNEYWQGHELTHQALAEQVIIIFDMMSVRSSASKTKSHLLSLRIRLMGY